jgi:probable rRNA maturation factor
VKWSLRLFNRQRKKRVDLQRLLAFAEAATAKVAELYQPLGFPEEINVVLVSDARIAGIHRQFLSIEGPTDVITFRHGEIVISVDTAERQAKIFATSLNRELRLYVVHGLLHLAGLEDLTDRGFDEMADAQQQIVEEVERTLSVRD